MHCGNHGNENVMTINETIRLIVLRYLLYQLSRLPMDSKQKLRMDKKLHCSSKFKTEGKLTGAMMKKCDYELTLAENFRQLKRTSNRI